MANDFKFKIDTKLQIAVLMATIVAIIITVIFSLRAERTKEITITYLSKRSLVAIEGPHPNPGLEVRLAGNVIAAPWLVSAKLENTGNVPIEERDIEARAKLSFTKGKTIAADILAKNQPGLFAAIKLTGAEVEIEHKLLNPGDWLAFDILFDGEPEIPPALTLRVSGVSKPIQVVASSETRRTYPTLFSLPPPLTYLALVVSTLIPLACFILAIAIGKSYVTALFGLGKPLPFKSNLEMILAKPVSIKPSSVPARTLYAALGEPPPFELLSSGDSLALALAKLPAIFFQGLNLTVERAAELLRLELMQDLYHLLERFVGFDYPEQREVMIEEFRRLDLDKLSPDQFLEGVRKIQARFPVKSPGNFRPDGRRGTEISELVGLLGATLLGLCLIFILGGTWRSVLGL